MVLQDDATISAVLAYAVVAEPATKSSMTQGSSVACAADCLLGD